MSAGRAEAAAMTRPEARIRMANASEPRGTLVTLHGGGANPQ